MCHVGSNSTNPLNAELNPICHLLALLGTHHILHVSRIRVKNVTITTGTLREDLCTFSIISHIILLKVRNVSNL